MFIDCVTMSTTIYKVKTWGFALCHFHDVDPHLFPTILQFHCSYRIVYPHIILRDVKNSPQLSNKSLINRNGKKVIESLAALVGSELVESLNVEKPEEDILRLDFLIRHCALNSLPALLDVIDHMNLFLK